MWFPGPGIVRLAGLACLILAAGPWATAPGLGRAQQPAATPGSVQPAPTNTPLPTPRTNPPSTTVGQTGQPGPSGQPGQPTPPPAQTGSVTARITYPPSGQLINLQPFLVVLDVTGIRLDAGQIGQPSAPGVGHWLFLIDGTEITSGDVAQFSVGGVPPGTHELGLQVRNNDRSPLMPAVSTAMTVCLEACSEVPLPPTLPEVPGGLPRTGTGGLLDPRPRPRPAACLPVWPASC